MNKHEIVYGIGVIALATQLTSIVTNNWSISNLDGLATTDMGLWKSHEVSIGGVAQDIHLPPNNNNKFPKNSLYACRIFAVIGVLCVFTSLVAMYKYPSKMLVHYWLLLIGGIASLLSMIIWTVEMLNIDGVKYSTGYSFHLQWLGGVMAIVAAIYHGSK